MLSRNTSSSQTLIYLYAFLLLASNNVPFLCHPWSSLIAPSFSYPAVAVFPCPLSTARWNPVFSLVPRLAPGTVWPLLFLTVFQYGLARFLTSHLFSALLGKTRFEGEMWLF
jgi:hypothetical protein